MELSTVFHTLFQALSGEVCYRTCLCSHMQKSAQKCDTSHAEIKLLATHFPPPQVIAFL